LREEHRFKVFENRVLRRTFATKTAEVRGGKRKVQSQQLRDFYFSLDIMRAIKSGRIKGGGGYVAHIRRGRQ
jgi:hypothetical protein